MLDLRLDGGTVYDGTGVAGERLDVGIRDGRIVSLGLRAEDRAGETLHLEGLAIAPGFIDPHSHADLVLVQEPSRMQGLLEGRALQGITTLIVGNCGMGIAPAPAADRSALRRLNAWMTPADVEWPWTDLGGYLDELEHRPLPLNVGALQPHGPLRLWAHGPGSGGPGPDGLAAMRAGVREAMEAGAFGLSAGLIYPPGMYADTRELIDLASEVAGHDGVFACHLRGSSELLLPSVDELITIGERSGCRVHHSHSEAVGRDHWTKIGAVLDREGSARARGVRLSHDLFPYHAAATQLAALFPPSALVGGIDGLLDRLNDPGSRRALRREVAETVPTWPPWMDGGWPHNLVRAVGWSSIRIASVGSDGARTGEPIIGSDVASLARRSGSHPFDVAADLMVEHRGAVGQLLFGITGDDDDEEPMRLLLADRHGAICTDAEDFGRGLPHPAAFGACPRVLGRWVRDRGTLSLPEAIRRMTSLPADLFGLERRGRIRRGFPADLVVFDPDVVADRADYAQPRRGAAGIHHVLVNGTPVVKEGRYLGRAAGQVLRR